MIHIKQIQALNKMLLAELPEYREQAAAFPMEKWHSGGSYAP